jgi:uncharacterized protein YaaR (DUF327 family)
MLEQDGRGMEYGMSIDRKISIPCYRNVIGAKMTVKNFARYILGKKVKNESHVSVNSVDQVFSMIKNDARKGFEKFAGVDKKIDSFSKNNLKLLKNI